MDILYRSFGLDRRKIDEENRTAEIIYSTENPVDSWYGAEILLHNKKNVDTSRLDTGSVLFNHDADKIIGPILSHSVSGFVGRAVVGFDDDEIGNMAFGKVKSGSLRGVSVGYVIEEAVRVYEKEKYPVRDGLEIKGPALIATRWTPHEITLTPIPADKGAGVRSRSLTGIHIIENRPENRTRTDLEQLRYLKIKYR